MAGDIGSKDWSVIWRISDGVGDILVNKGRGYHVVSAFFLLAFWVHAGTLATPGYSLLIARDCEVITGLVLIVGKV